VDCNCKSKMAWPPRPDGKWCWISPRSRVCRILSRQPIRMGCGSSSTPAYQGIGVAFPCAEVNIANGLDRGFAVLQTPSSATHVIVVPTTRISGIENPALLRENAPNYWEAAWDARRFVEEGVRRRLSRDKIGMTITRENSDLPDDYVRALAPGVDGPPGQNRRRPNLGELIFRETVEG
jgi:hypothetical protein